MITIMVTLLFGSRRNEEMFDELFIRQNTGLGIAKADAH
jgi:cation/acetate symporter